MLLFIRIIRPIIHIRFGKLRADRIGHYLPDYYLGHCENKSKSLTTTELKKLQTKTFYSRLKNKQNIRYPN